MVVDYNGPVFANGLDVYFLCNATTDNDVPITNYRLVFYFYLKYVALWVISSF